MGPTAQHSDFTDDRSSALKADSLRAQSAILHAAAPRGLPGGAPAPARTGRSNVLRMRSRA